MATPRRTTRYRTVFVDPDLLASVAQRDDEHPRQPGPRCIGVDQRVDGCRRNVRDAARAVLTWVAAVLGDGDADLARILDECLRPGPDARRVNYAALAARVNAHCGTDLSAKRIRTAIANLRRTPGETPQPQPGPAEDRAAQVRRKLTANFDQLVAADSPRRAKVRRAIATDLLAAVRVAADRLIDKPYGEGIGDSFDAGALEGRLLDFVRSMVADGDAMSSRTEPTLRDLLRVLGRADGTGESDMAVVIAAARGVSALMGPDSLAGLLAQLNVLVVGRDLLGTELYVAEMYRIGESAAALHEDPSAARYQNWARRLDTASRVPAPLRVASYARNNLATHVLQRLITGELADAENYLPLAEAAIEAMRRSDGSFRLLPVTEAIHATALTQTGRDPDAAGDYFPALGEDGAEAVLRDLARFDSSRAVIEAVRGRAVEALPGLRYRLIVI